MSFLRIQKSQFSWGKGRNDFVGLGKISLTFTTHRKMGNMRRVVNQFHTACDAFYGTRTLYRKNLPRVVNSQCVQTSRKIIGLQDNTRHKV